MCFSAPYRWTLIGYTWLMIHHGGVRSFALVVVTLQRQVTMTSHEEPMYSVFWTSRLTAHWLRSFNVGKLKKGQQYSCRGGSAYIYLYTVTVGVLQWWWQWFIYRYNCVWHIDLQQERETQWALVGHPSIIHNAAFWVVNNHVIIS